MSYEIELSPDAIIDIEKLRRAGEKAALKKIDALLDELAEHPYTGTGKPERLGYNLSGKWSRRITDKHRLVYEVNETKVIVSVLNTYGHYGDK